jgi:hypothetical protein
MRMPIVVLALGACLAGPLAAQGLPNSRQGFWIGAGLGAGSVGADCSSCPADRSTGFSGYLRLGGTVSPSLLVGAETNGWTHSESGQDQGMGFGSAVLYWYPGSTGALYLKLGLGGMSYKSTGGADEVTATAGAATVGIGYEFRVQSNLSIALFLNSMASAPARFKVNGQVAPTSEDIRLNLVQVGMGLTWH